MKQSIQAYYDFDEYSSDEYEYYPAEKCPICHSTLNGNYLYAFICESGDNVRTLQHDVDSLYAMHYCSMCDGCFLGIYTRTSDNPFQLIQAVPKKPTPVSFPRCIQTLSRRFVDVYTQASEAENQHLFEICGMGYRLALEILIKDFSIHFFPDKKDIIINSSISKCIEDYIKYDKLKNVAKRAVWLGNDHSHYQAKHIDKDLKDLKLLVDLTMHWATIELETEEAEQIQPIK